MFVVRSKPFRAALSRRHFSAVCKIHNGATRRTLPFCSMFQFRVSQLCPCCKMASDLGPFEVGQILALPWHSGAPGGMHDASDGRQGLMSTLRGCTPLEPYGAQTPTHARAAHSGCTGVHARRDACAVLACSSCAENMRLVGRLVKNLTRRHNAGPNPIFNSQNAQSPCSPR